MISIDVKDVSPGESDSKLIYLLLGIIHLLGGIFQCIFSMWTKTEANIVC